EDRLGLCRAGPVRPRHQRHRIGWHGRGEYRLRRRLRLNLRGQRLYLHRLLTAPDHRHAAHVLSAPPTRHVPRGSIRAAHDNGGITTCRTTNSTSTSASWSPTTAPPR